MSKQSNHSEEPTNAASSTQPPRKSTPSRTVPTRTPDSTSLSGEETHQCPHCDADDGITHVDGETLCESCGTIFDDRETLCRQRPRYDDDPEKRQARRRTAPTMEMHADGARRTTIGYQGEHNTINMSEAQRSWMQRIKSGWQKFSQDRQRGNMYGRNEIARMLTSLGYQGDYNTQAVDLFRKGTAESLSHGRSIEEHAAACVYAILRINRVPVTLDDIARVARADKRSISNMYSVLTSEHSLPIPVQHPADYVTRIASEVGAPRELERTATELLKKIHNRQLGQGKHPAGLAAGALNALEVLTPPEYYYSDNSSPTISALADAAEVASPTVSENTNRFEEFLCEEEATAPVATSLDSPIVCQRTTAN